LGAIRRASASPPKIGKIYVANSGGLDFQDANYDHTVSVIDLNSFEEIEQIEVGLNPYQVFADSQGDVYVKRSRKLYRYRPEFQKNKAFKRFVRSVYAYRRVGFGIYDRQRQSVHSAQRMGKRK
jgi:hypothetical protein